MEANQIIITRNDVALPFKNFKILKGKRKDVQYPAPDIQVGNLETFLKWLGVADVVNQLQTDFKRRFQV